MSNSGSQLPLEAVASVRAFTLSNFLGGLEKVKEELGAKHPFLTAEDVSYIGQRLQKYVEAGTKYDTYEALFTNGYLFDGDPETLPEMLIAVLAAHHVLAAAEPAQPQRFAELDLRSGVPFKQAKVMYGDTVVDGNLYFDDRLVVVGDLTVGGVIEATEDFSPLFVAGDVRARGINCYRWCGSVIVGGEVQVDEALAVSQNLAAGGLVRAKMILEGEGLWKISAALESEFHFSHAQIEEGSEGPLGAIFSPKILAPDPSLADDHAFIHNLFDALRSGKSIR